MRTRRFITCAENNYNYEFSDDSKVITRESSLVDPFYTEENICPDDGQMTIAYVDPLIMLFNQERLSQMGDAAVKMWIDSLSKNASSGVNELKSKLSDDELIQLVKSRHIQTPSELQAYFEWCNENVDLLNAELQKAQQAQADAAKQQADKQTIVEPKPTE